MDGQNFIVQHKTPSCPTLPGASDPVSINKALLEYFFLPKEPLPSRGRLSHTPSASPLMTEAIAHAHSESSPSSAPGPDGVSYSVWKMVNSLNIEIILDLISPLVFFYYYPPSLGTANGVVLDMSGKPCSDSSSSFRIIVLLKTLSKILEPIMTVGGSQA